MRRFVNKYHAQKVTCALNHGHDSKMEAKRCSELQLLERAGTIRNLSFHPQFWFVIDGRPLKHPNGHRVGYKADFQYFEGNANVVEDCKGVTVRDWPLRRAVFKALFPFIELREIKR